MSVTTDCKSTCDKLSRLHNTIGTPIRTPSRSSAHPIIGRKVRVQLTDSQNESCEILRVIGRYKDANPWGTSGLLINIHVPACWRCYGHCYISDESIAALLENRSRAIVYLSLPRSERANNQPLLQETRS